MTNLVILISGGGSNMRAIVQAAQRERWHSRYGAQVACVLSNQPDAAGLSWAQSQGIATAVVNHRDYAQREAFDAALAAQIAPYDSAERPALVVLAGFMRILTPQFTARFAGRMLNIHPSLLPAFAGLHTHQRALEAGCQFAGATVHQVTAELDHGPILAQAVVPILPQDTPQALANRVLSQEHRIYPRAIAAWLAQAQKQEQAIPTSTSPNATLR